MKSLKGIIGYKLHTRVSTISHADFTDVLLNGNKKKLIAKKPLFPIRKPDLKKAWEQLYDDYFIARGLSPKNMRQIVKVEELKSLYSTLGVFIRLLGNSDGKALDLVLIRLDEMGYGIDKSKPMKDEVERLLSNWQSLKNAIKIEGSQIVKGNPYEEKDYLSEWSRMEDLKRRDLDPTKITEARWIVMITEEVNKAKQKSE